jgi:hypothetical protein
MDIWRHEYLGQMDKIARCGKNVTRGPGAEHGFVGVRMIRYAPMDDVAHPLHTEYFDVTVIRDEAPPLSIVTRRPASPSERRRL